MNWRDAAARLRTLPKGLLAQNLTGLTDASTDQDVIKALLVRVPDLADSIDVSDIDAPSQASLDSKASFWKTAHQAVDETFSFPINEALRRTGAMDTEDTLGEAAARKVGGGVPGAAANIATRVLTDPTSFVPNPTTVSKTLGALIAAGKGLQVYQVMKVGQEKGFTSPDFFAAVAGAATAHGVAQVAGRVPGAVRGDMAKKPEVLTGYKETSPGAFVSESGNVRIQARPGTMRAEPSKTVTPPIAPSVVEPSPLDSSGLANVTAGLPVAPVSRPQDIEALRQAEAFNRLYGPTSAEAPKDPAAEIARVLEAVKRQVGEPVHVEPEAVVKAARLEDETGLDELAPVVPEPVAPPAAPATPKKKPYKAEAHLDDDTRAIIDSDAQSLVKSLSGVPLANMEPIPIGRYAMGGPFYKWDLLKELGHGEAEVKSWPKYLRDLMRDGGRNDPLHPNLRSPEVEVLSPFDVRAEAAQDDGWIDSWRDFPQAIMEGRLHPDPSHHSRTGGKVDEAGLEALGVLDELVQRTGMKPMNILSALKGKRESPAKIKVREALMAMDPNGLQGYVANQKRGAELERAEVLPEIVAPATVQEAAPFALPRDLAGAKPRYKTLQLDFEDDIDKALYILAQKNPSKHDARYLKAVVEQTGMTEAEARRAGADVRSRIRVIADAASGEETVRVPREDIEALEREGIQNYSRKPTGKKSRLPIEEQMARLDAKPKFRDGTDKSLAAEKLDNSANVREIQALIKLHGGANTPAFKAALAERAAQNRPTVPPRASESDPSDGLDPAEPIPPARPAEPESAPVRLAPYDAPEFHFEGTGDPKVGRIKKWLQKAGSAMGTEVSRLHSLAMNKTADKIDHFGNAIDYSIIDDSTKFQALKATKAELAQAAALVELSAPPMGTQKQQARIREIAKEVQSILNRTHQIATERDPAGAAPWEPNYWPRSGVREGAEPPVYGTDNLQRPLDVVGQSKAPSLTKERVINMDDIDAESFSRPITDPDELLATIVRRARNAGALEAGATMERTPENYPRTWKAILDSEMAAASRGLGEDADGVPKELSEAATLKAQEAAKEKFESLQLPDLFEAAATDRPKATWEQLVQNEDLVKASKAVIRGIDAMDPTARTFTNATGAVSSALQLGYAPALNLLGLQNVYPIAKDALKNKGHGELVASTIAAWRTAKAGLLGGRALAEDMAAAVGRPFGGGLSRPQREFGRSGSTWNLARRAVAVTDRAARTGSADALEDLIPYMRPESLKFIDRTKPMTDPKNIKIARREIAALTQGSGNSANKIRPTGNAAIDTVREMGLQYTGPAARLFEKATPRALAAPIGTAMAAVLYGELANNFRAVQRGTGLNAGAPETEDQKKGRTFDPKHPIDSGAATFKMVVSGDRSPHLGVRIIQDLIPSIPGAQGLLSNAAFNVSRGGPAAQTVGSFFPAVGALNQTTKAVSLAFETGDLRPVLAIVNAPGLGNEWLKVVALEAARRETKAKGKAKQEVGLGQVPQNSGWAFKIDQMAKGQVTFEEVLKDLVTNEQIGIEGPSNRHRAKLNAAEAKRDR